MSVNKGLFTLPSGTKIGLSIYITTSMCSLFWYWCIHPLEGGAQIYHKRIDQHDNNVKHGDTRGCYNNLSREKEAKAETVVVCAAIKHSVKWVPKWETDDTYNSQNFKTTALSFLSNPHLIPSNPPPVPIKNVSPTYITSLLQKFWNFLVLLLCLCFTNDHTNTLLLSISEVCSVDLSL